MKISRDNPCYYITCVCNSRLPVFRTDTVKQVVTDALNEARRSGRFRIFAYVIMPDHIHLITDSVLSIGQTLRFVNGITARRVIDYLKNGGFQASLAKLQRLESSKNYRYSLWDHHPNVFRIEHEKTLMQKAEYIHENPVRAGLVEKASDYRFSSARIWQGQPLDDEPLEVDFDEIDWRWRPGGY